MTTPRVIHAIPSGPDIREHRASGTCPCGPTLHHDIEEPSRLVFVHHRESEPEQLERSIGAEQLNGFAGVR